MLRRLLEDCVESRFAEVVLMLSNSASTAEIYMDFDDLRFTDAGDIVTVMDPDGTHVHLKMDRVRSGRLVHTTNNLGLPSYQLWLLDAGEQPLLRVYLRKSDDGAANPARHKNFLALIEKYGEDFALSI